MPRVLVTPPLLADRQGGYYEVLANAGWDVVFPTDYPSLNTTAGLISQLKGIDATLASVEPYTRAVFEGTKLRCVARVGVGYDAVEVPAATNHKVAVCITPGTNEHSVAEQAFSMLFSVFRDVAIRDAEVRAGGWRRNPVRRLAGNTIGLVGLGRIGKAMVPRAHGLGLKVVGYDPFADKDFAAKNNVRLCTFEELLAASDIVSLHMPCTAETTNLINRKSLALMKPDAVLVNTSRGGLVDEDALLEALTSKKLFGAALDVLKVEPPPKDHPFFKLKNVTLAPHMGGIDQTALDAMAKLGAEVIVALHRTNEAPAGCVVNAAELGPWKW
jgi:phosphoglycerate dehydrogenase-like enzyme